MNLINACIFTLEGETIENGYLSFENGVITAFGDMKEFCASGETLDLKDACVYPGLVDAHAHLGMWEDALGFEGDDGNEDTEPCTPHLRAIDAINPNDFCFKEAYMAGVTTVVTGPGSANPVGGQMAAMKTYGACVDDMIIDPFCAMKFALGENPKSVYHGKNQAPVTRMATVAMIREQLMKAKKYSELLVRAKNDPDEEEPEFDMKCEALLPIIRGEIPAHFHAHRLDDIFSVMRIAKEFSLKYVLVHATQGYKQAERLTGVPVLCGPVICDRSKPELAGHSAAAAGALTAAGVETAIITDHPVVPIQYLALSAAVCVREGLDREEALKAITITPAKICGIDDRVGSIAVGKDADILVVRGDVFFEKPEMVFVSGRRIK